MDLNITPSVSHADKRRREIEYRKKIEYSLAIISRWERTIEVCEALSLREFSIPSENESYRYDGLRNEWQIMFRSKFTTIIVKELDSNNWYLFFDNGGVVKEYGLKAVQRFIFNNITKM